MFKDCWDGKKQEVELSQISSKGFDIAAHWIYSGNLPPNLTDYSQKNICSVMANNLYAYKAADVLMMNELQNELILQEAACLRETRRFLSCVRLNRPHDYDLLHTKYYTFSLRSATENMMLHRTPEEWTE